MQYGSKASERSTHKSAPYQQQEKQQSYCRVYNNEQPDVDFLISHAAVRSHLLEQFNTCPEYPIDHAAIIQQLLATAQVQQSLERIFVSEGRGRGDIDRFLTPPSLPDGMARCVNSRQSLLAMASQGLTC